MQVGAVLRAEKIARSAARLRKFSDRKWAKSLQILCAVAGRRAAHPNFGRRRCVHILALQNFCVELLARAMPKTHTSNVEHAQDFAKICINDARNCCRFFAMSARGALNGRAQRLTPSKCTFLGKIIQNFKKNLIVFTERNATKDEDIIEASLHMKVKKWSPTPSPPSQC